MAKDYTSTLNLPATEFPMRAGLPQKEPQTLAYWDSIDLYNKMQENAKDKPLYVLHDGPPFSNGNIHMGTAMNKILKDLTIQMLMTLLMVLLGWLKLLKILLPQLWRT